MKSKTRVLSTTLFVILGLGTELALRSYTQHSVPPGFLILAEPEAKTSWKKAPAPTTTASSEPKDQAD